jgi:hypothetical protein
MYIITVIETKQSYYSKCLGSLSYIAGVSRQTLYNWLKHPGKAVNKGYILAVGEHIKSKRRGRM